MLRLKVSELVLVIKLCLLKGFINELIGDFVDEVALIDDFVDEMALIGSLSI